MSDTDNVSDLESALVDRAEKLAEEYLAGARLVREQILAETTQRLQIEEEREVLVAKAQADRAYQQRVQSAELNLRADLDRMRWQLVNDVLAMLPQTLAGLAADEPRYRPVLLAYLREGARAIEGGELIAQVNERDFQRLRNEWEKYAQHAAPSRRVALSPKTLGCAGGILITSADGNIRIDNTFEGRMERLAEALQTTVAERLMPSGDQGHGDYD